MEEKLKDLQYKIKIGMLCEYYGKLLTTKQYEFLNDYYNNDLSLSEIAQNYQITRQAVRDIIKKGEKKVFEYEEKLKFMKKTLHQKNKIEDIMLELDKIQNIEYSNKIKEIVKNIQKDLSNIF